MDTVLIADADERVRAFLADNMAADGFAVEQAQSATQARFVLTNRAADLMVLGELDQPGEPLALLRALRGGEEGGELPTLVPVLVLCADRSERALLRAFEAGCDDLVRKPFIYGELLARTRALLARGRRAPARELQVGALEIDTLAKDVRYAGEAVELSRLEFNFLAHLAQDPVRVFSKQELFEAVWGASPGCPVRTTRTVDAHACRVRSKLARAGAPDMVKNRRGLGYRLIDAQVSY